MTTDATRAHIDAETLAAWAEHGLSAEASAGVELHLSHCDRCQEMLAAFVRSEPAVGAVILPFWTRRPVQWSAAGLAAAAALVAFVWIGRPPALPRPESTVAVDSASASASAEVRRDRSASVADELASKSGSGAGQQLAKTSPAPSAPAPAELRADKPSSKALREVESKKESARVATEPVAAPRPVAAPPASVSAGIPGLPAPPPPAATQPPAVPLPVAVSAAAPVVTVGGTAARSESVLMDLVKPLEVVAPDRSADLASRAAATGAGRGGGAGARSSFNQLAVPARWRVISGTLVERSTDAGASWAPLPIEPPLTSPLVAGAAASQLECWFVGAQGVVLVTTDGRTFRRVSLPESILLTSVTATDGLRATVTAADGRKFSTADGGLTWK